MAELDLDELERLAKARPTFPHEAGTMLALIAKVRELEQDAARLDWLMRQVCCDDIGLDLPLVHDSDMHYRNFRAAIDAARKENHTRPNVRGATFMDPPGTRRQHVQD